MAVKNYSGKFVVRLDPATHRKLVAEARSQGKSLNYIVRSLISEGLKKSKEIFGSMVS